MHDVIINIAAACEAFQPETIQNCFKKAGFRNNVDNFLLEEVQLALLQNFPGYTSIDDKN